MNVVFWSYTPGVSSVSSSMLATALTTAIKYKVRCSVMQLHLDRNGLFPAIIAQGDESALTTYENTGVDALVRLAKGGSASIEDVEATAFSFAGQAFNILLNSKQPSEEIYKNDLMPQLPGMFRLLDSAFHINFIDVPAGMNAYSAEALNLADIIVVCLPQSRWMIRQLFDSCSFSKEKIFFLFGDYDRSRSMNINNFSRIYHKTMKAGRCLAIPHSVGYANAMDNNKAISFFLQNVECKNIDSNHAFIKGCMNTAEKLLKVNERR